MIRKLQKAWMTMAVTALVLCGFAVSSQAQTYTSLWERAAIDGNLPTWFGGDTERGMGFGTVDGNDRMYVVSRNAGLSVRIVDAMTGADVGTLPNGTDIISGGLFSLQDAEVSDDGVIFAANMTLDATAPANPFKVYMWTSESSDPVNVVNFSSDLIVRLGDKFTVTGSVADETAVIWAAASPATGGTVYPVYKFSMSEGAFSSVPEIITLSAGAIGASAVVGPLPNGDFWHNSNGQPARKYQADGTLIAEIPTSILAGGTNSIRYLGTEGNVEQFVTFQYGAGEERAVLVTITDADFENATTEKTRALRQNANGNGAGAVDVKFYEDGEYDVFLLSTNNAIAAYTTREIVPEPEFARLQVIHNAADPGAALVDIYVNGDLLLDDFAFRAATPFIDVPAGVELSIAVAPPTSTSVDDAIATFPVTLAADETYVVFANGVLDPNDFAANPDALDIGFTLIPVANAREAAENIDNVEFFVFHGATDAPAVDVLTGETKLVDGASYGDATGYLSVPPAPYTLDVTLAGANEFIVATFTADLTGTAGASAVVFASGFLNPETNQNGASFALGVALADGTVLVIEPDAPAPGLFTEYFEYTIGGLLVDNGWAAHSGGGTNSIAVADQTLVYDGYAGSGIGNVANMPAVAGEDVHRMVGSYTSGNIYAAALVNVTSASTGGDYFIHLGPEPISTVFRGRVFVRSDGDDKIAFGISKAGGAAAADFTGFDYSLGETVLLVLEYEFVEDGADIAKLHVNPVGSEVPAAATVSDAAGADLPNLSNIALRQGGAASTPGVVVGGIRVGTDYAEVVGDPAAPPATARLQVVHNAADPAAAEVDVYVNGDLLLDNFAFRTATGFVTVPAEVELSIAVAPPNSESVADAIATFPVTLDADENYVVFANGVLDPLSFAANPGGLDIGFTLFPVPGARLTADNPSNVELFVFHGATDAPAVDVLTGETKLVDNAAYGDATGYLSVPPAFYVLDITPAGDNETIVASFEADLNGLAGGTAVVAASGFLDPSANQDGAAFTLIAVLADGTVIELPAFEGFEPVDFSANLSGLNEVPANLSEGSGTISLVLTGNELVVSGSFSGLGSNYTMSHIHTGAAGTNGGVVVTLDATLDGDQLGGTYEAADNTFTLTGEQVNAMNAGTYYVNIHSDEFPAGELRGQIYLEPNTAPTQVAITAPADNADVTLEGLRSQSFTASWETATDAEEHPVLYVWQLSAVPDFSEVVLNVGPGTGTSVSFTFGDVDDLLAAAGVEAGGTITVYHRAISSDGSLLTVGDGASVNVTRGDLIDALTIAEALATEIGTIVTVDGIVTRARGRESRIQDSTGAMGTFAQSGDFFDAIGDGSVAQGDLVRITGRRAAFNNLDQIDNITAFEVLSRDNDLPEPVLVTLADIRDNGEAYKSALIRVEDITINPAGDVTFSAGTGSGKTYRITDATVTEEAIVDFRVPNVINTDIVGTTIPTVPFAFEGVLGVFSTTFQLYAVNATDVIVPFSPLAGDYYIPQGENPQGFLSLAQAIEAINTVGLADHATLLIDADLDEGDAVLRINRDDLSEDTRLTIKPAPGKQVTVHAADFRLVDTGYITVDGSADGDGARDLTFMKNSPAGGFIGLFSNTMNIELKNFNVMYDENFGLNTYAFIINRRESGTTDTGRAEDVLLENLQVGSAEKPFNDGVWLFGSTTIAEFFHVNVTLSGNEFHVGRSALRTQTHTNTVFNGNVVRNYGTVDAALIESVRLNTPIETFTFTNNEIVFVGTTRAAATTFVGLNGTNSLVEVVAVYNNTFTNAGFEGEGTEHSFVGFRHDGGASSAQFRLFHNSFRLGATGNSGLQAAVGKNAGASGAASVNVVNNIIVNERDAENSYAYQWSGGGFSADYNNIVTTGDGGVALIGETRYATLAEFAGATPNDANSSMAEVEFVSNTDLRLTGASIGDNRLGGTPLTAVTTDIDGTERSGTTPYKGAFEGDVALVPALEAIGPFALVFPTDGFSLTLQGDAATEVEIQWEMPESGEAWARMGGTLENDAFAHGGGGTNAQGKYLGMNLGQEAWIRTPKVMNPGVFKFWAATYSAATVLNLAVEISEDGMDWDELTSFTALAGDAGDITSSWQQMEVEVNREGAFYLRWRQHGETIAGAAYFDDVELSIMGTDTVLEEGFEGWEAFQELKFTWHADLPGNDFSEPLLSIPSDNNGAANTLTLNYGAIDAALDGLGIEQGASVNVIWTVTAEFMEDVRFADSPFALTITRNLDVSTERVEMPLAFSLSQNYPNPFNPATNIKFTLPETIDVRLEVYNIAGQRVATLVNSQMNAGEHVVSFDARALASGVYIYRIIAGDFVKSHKMTLIK